MAGTIKISTDQVEAIATRYFQNYHDIIDAYVKFLRQNVAADYVTTETSNTNLAEAFK